MPGKPSAAIIGGGLAGMMVARQLARSGFEVTIYEAGDRLGGKATAFSRVPRRPDAGAPASGPELFEHGYHFFPGWYVNTRRLLEDIGQHGLVDLDRWHYVEPRTGSGDGRIRAVPMPKSVWDLPTFLETLRGSPASLAQMALYYYFVLDTVGEEMGREHTAPTPQRKLARWALDRVSRTGLLRERWYATGELARLDVQNTLKASAIPAHEMSAFTVKNLTDFWLASLRPFLSILPGNLHDELIEPFRIHIEALGVHVELGTEVLAIDEVADGRLQPISIRGRDGSERRLSADAYVVTTPLEVTRRLIGRAVYDADHSLGSISHLEAGAMAALHLRLNHARAYPREHVAFLWGEYGLSFIDLSKTWPPRGVPAGEEPPSYLSFIATDFAPIADLAGLEGEALERAQYGLLMDEIERYLEIDRERDVESWVLMPNVDTPLFLNSVGAWSHRPKTTCALPNLFFAGDWVRNVADLTCMESAICAALDASHHIAARYRGAYPSLDVPPPAEEPPRFGERKARWLARLLAPAALPLYLAARLSEESK